MSESWVLWSDDGTELLAYVDFDASSGPEYLDNLNRMLDGVNPLDFMLDELRADFSRDYIQT